MLSKEILGYYLPFYHSQKHKYFFYILNLVTKNLVKVFKKKKLYTYGIV